jgi:tetratricopeptide (TPR) repeat protein
MEALALTTPAGDNALETLQRVLAAMPSQPDALQGIHDIANKYAELAEQAERRGEHGLAKRYVDKGLDLAPDDPDLLAAQQQLTEQPAVPQPLGDAGAGGPPPETIGPVELAELLARARQQMEALALTTPAGDNALETLQRVLAAVPGQPDALQGIHDIASKYAILAAQAERRGEHALAKRYLDKGLVVAPDDPDLFAAQQKMTAQPAF